MIKKRHASNPAIKNLQQIPGIGPSIAQDLYDLGITVIADLVNKSPEHLYAKLCAIHGTHIDRCVLYTFRCAIYYASTKKHDPELLKWWNWKDSVRKKF